MDTIEKDGKTYNIYRWRKADECKDIPVGEVCIVLYPAGFSPYPIMAYSDGNGRFYSMGKIEIPVQPLYAIQIPPVGGIALIDNS